MIRETLLVFVVLIPIAPDAPRAFAAETSPTLPSGMRLPRSISSRSVNMFSRAKLLVSSATRKEFNFSDAQADQIDNLLREWSAAEEESNRRPAPRDQIRTLNTETTSKTQEYLLRLQSLLTAEQNTLLDRLVLRSNGLGIFMTHDPIAASLELSDEQSRQVKVIYRDRNASSESRLKRWLEILTPEQRKIWDEITGDDFVLPDRAQRSQHAMSMEIPSVRAPATLMQKAWVRQDLDLTAEQSAKIDTLFGMLGVQRSGLDEQLIAGARGEMLRNEIEALRTLTEETSKQLLDAISEPQRKRLDQLVLQIDGPFAFQRLETQRRLGLDSAQSASITRLMHEFQSFVIGTRNEDRVNLSDETSEKKKQLLKDYLSLLTPEQRQEWQEMVGPIANQTPDGESVP